MKTLKFKFDLDSKVAIYVPSTINVSEEIDNTKQVLDVIRKLSEMFGGATASDAESWMLKVVGDAIRNRSSEHFWNNGCYSWFIYISKEVRSIEQRVFLTHNGILVFEDCTEEEMYRVHPM